MKQLKAVTERNTGATALLRRFAGHNLSSVIVQQTRWQTTVYPETGLDRAVVQITLQGFPDYHLVSLSVTGYGSVNTIMGMLARMGYTSSDPEKQGQIIVYRLQHEREGISISITAVERSMTITMGRYPPPFGITQRISQRMGTLAQVFLLHLS